MTTWIWADNKQIAVERAVSCFPELEEVVEVEQAPMQMGMRLYRIKVKDTAQSPPSTDAVPDINKALELAESINRELDIEDGVRMTKWVWATDPDDAIEQANDNLGYTSLEAAKARTDLMQSPLQIFKVEVTKA